MAKPAKLVPSGLEIPMAVVNTCWARLELAVVADFDGDGKSDILWQHDSGLPASGRLRREITTADLG
jgi:hypothetical protein